MSRASLTTSVLGLTEPIFVPGYWNPPSLFAWAAFGLHWSGVYEHYTWTESMAHARVS